MAALSQPELKVVTPDWVSAGVSAGHKVEEGLYHPRLVEWPRPDPPTPPPGEAYTLYFLLLFFLMMGPPSYVSKMVGYQQFSVSRLFSRYST